jgi:hypothetical protein
LSKKHKFCQLQRAFKNQRKLRLIKYFRYIYRTQSTSFKNHFDQNLESLILRIVPKWIIINTENFQPNISIYILISLVRELLKSWGLEKHVEKFELERITLEHIRHIEDAELKELIPEIVDRIEFKKNRQFWIDSTVSNS